MPGRNEGDDMLNMDMVESTIQELENADTTFNNCDKLASLYIVRHYFNKGLNPVVNGETSLDVIKELSDIMPHYSIYCDKKRDYQLNKVGEDVVLTSLRAVCREITEFLHTLYSSTDMPEERDIIVGTFSNLQF